MKAWELEVGATEESMDHHQALVNKSVEVLVQQGGGVRRCHIDWDKIEDSVLQTREGSEMQVKHPGYKHWRLSAYLIEFANKDQTGHIRRVVAGVDGVLVPKEDIREVE